MKQSEEIKLTVKILLKDSHPAIAEHSGYVCKKLGELLLQKTGEEVMRKEIARTLELPEGVPFKLNIIAAHEGIRKTDKDY